MSKVTEEVKAIIEETAKITENNEIVREENTKKLFEWCSKRLFVGKLVFCILFCFGLFYLLFLVSYFFVMLYFMNKRSLAKQAKTFGLLLGSMRHNVKKLSIKEREKQICLKYLEDDIYNVWEEKGLFAVYNTMFKLDKIICDKLYKIENK